MRYTIKLYDISLIKFEFADEGNLIVEYSFDENYRHLLPIGLELSCDGIAAWLAKRTIPRNRTFVQEILGSLGVSPNDIRGIMDISKGLSLNDSYWVVGENFDGKFKDFNLYENQFDKILSLIAYTGQGHSHMLLSSSPELTTGGMLPKAWRTTKNPDGIFLYKGGSSGFANSGKEPYSEFYAAQIAESMGLNHVKYGLEKWKGILASTCKLFTDIDTSYISVGAMVLSGGLEACVRKYDSLGAEFSEQIRSMLIFDALIYNEDRHFGNFGILRDNKTGEIIAPAPIFDNGISLFNYAMKDDINNLDTYAVSRTPPYTVPNNFTDICRRYLAPLQADQLRKMEGFKFDRHPKYNLDDERLSAIETHLQKRVRSLLINTPC